MPGQGRRLLPALLPGCQNGTSVPHKSCPLVFVAAAVQQLDCSWKLRSPLGHVRLSACFGGWHPAAIQAWSHVSLATLLSLLHQLPFLHLVLKLRLPLFPAPLPDLQQPHPGLGSPAAIAPAAGPADDLTLAAAALLLPQKWRPAAACGQARLPSSRHAADGPALAATPAFQPERARRSGICAAHKIGPLLCMHMLV